MLIRYLKQTSRILWRNRLFTALNIVGLSIGLSAAWIVWQYASFERSHDTQIPENNRIFRVVSNFIFNIELCSK
jgi:putative ABC transport system permease protein